MENIVFYDLETNGLDYYTTGIMQISILDINSNILVNDYVYPFDRRIDCSNIHGIDENVLKNNNAISTIELCMKIKKTLRETFGRKDIYFIAYNNFGYDQIILENNFRISNIKIPNNWYFTDLYPIIKELYNSNSSFQNYKLKTVYEKLCESNNNELITFHSSLDDTKCMIKIFFTLINNNKLNNELLNKYTRTLLTNNKIFDCPISSLQGYSKGMNFELKNIKKIGDIIEIYKKLNYNDYEMESYLQVILGIYSNYYLKNIVKQLGVIKNFQNL